jgi:hypothetical protein
MFRQRVDRQQMNYELYVLSLAMDTLVQSFVFHGKYTTAYRFLQKYLNVVRSTEQ